MSVTVFTPPANGLSQADYDAWRAVPAAVAVDLGRDIGQIDPAIRPLNPPGHQPRLFGRALTVCCDPPDFGAVVHALDVAKPGDVLMIAAAGQRDFAMIGEILGGHLRRLGCVGLVCDGAVRDVAELAAWSDFSVFTRFITPRGPGSAERGTINDAVVIGGCTVHAGDLIIGDDDGLVALSPSAIKSRIGDAQKKLGLEAQWMKSLTDGTSAAATFGLQPPNRAPK